MSKRARFDRVYSVDGSTGRVDVNAPAVFRQQAAITPHHQHQQSSVVSASSSLLVASPFASALPPARTTGLRHAAVNHPHRLFPSSSSAAAVVALSSSSSLLDHIDPETGALRLAQLRSEMMADAQSFVSPVTWAQAALARSALETQRCGMSEPNAVSAAISLVILDVLSSEENSHLFQRLTTSNSNTTNVSCVNTSGTMSHHQHSVVDNAASSLLSSSSSSGAAITPLLQRITKTLERSIFDTRQFGSIAYFDTCHLLAMQQRTAANRKPLILRALARADLEIKRVYLRCWLAHTKHMSQIRRSAACRGVLAKQREQRQHVKRFFGAWRDFMRARCRVLSSEAAKEALIRRLARYVVKLEQELGQARQFSQALVEDNKLSAVHLVAAEQKLADFVGWVKGDGIVGVVSSPPAPASFSASAAVRLLDIEDRKQPQQQQQPLAIEARAATVSERNFSDGNGNSNGSVVDEEEEEEEEDRARKDAIVRAADAARRLNDEQKQNGGRVPDELLVAAAKEASSSSASSSSCATKQLLQLQFDAVDNAVAAHDAQQQLDSRKRKKAEERRRKEEDDAEHKNESQTMMMTQAAASEALAVGEEAVAQAEAVMFRQKIASTEVLDWVSARVQCISISLSLDTGIDHHPHRHHQDSSSSGSSVITCHGRLSRMAATPSNFTTAFQSGQRLARLAVSLGAPNNLLQRISACGTQTEKLQEICDELNDLYRLAPIDDGKKNGQNSDNNTTAISQSRRHVPSSLLHIQAALQNRVSSLQSTAGSASPSSDHHQHQNQNLDNEQQQQQQQQQPVLGIVPSTITMGGKKLAECLSRLYHRFSHIPVAEPAMRNLDQIRRQQLTSSTAMVVRGNDVDADASPTALVLRKVENMERSGDDQERDDDGSGDVGSQRQMNQQLTRWYAELADQDSDLDAEVIEDELDPQGATVLHADGRRVRRQKRHEFMALISSSSSSSTTTDVDPVTRQIVERTLTKSMQTLQTLNAAVENATTTTTTDAQRKRMADVQARYKLAEAHSNVVRFVEDAVGAVVQQQHEMLASKRSSLMMMQQSSNTDDDDSKQHEQSRNKKKKSSRAEEIERIQKLQQEVDNMSPLAVLEACLLVSSSSHGMPVTSSSLLSSSVCARQVARGDGDTNDDDGRSNRGTKLNSVLDKSKEILLVEQLLHKHVTKNVRLRASMSIKKEDVVVSLRQLLTTLYVLTAENLVVLV